MRFSSLLDRVDADLDEILPVTLRPAVLLRPLLLEDEHLAAARLGEHRRLDGDVPGILRFLAGLAREDHAVQRQLVPLRDLLRRLLDPDDVSRRNLDLFSPGADDGVHEASKDGTADYGVFP